MRMKDVIERINYYAYIIIIDKEVKKIIDNAGWGVTNREIEHLLYLCESSKTRINAFNKFLVDLKIQLGLEDE
jgi:hypothetical protein